MAVSIHDALIAVQTALKAPKNQLNRFGGYNYRNCEDILEAAKPLLKEHGLALYVSDSIVLVGDRYYVRATAVVMKESESIEVTAFAREEETKKGMDASQITGAASSYARKYALNGLFLIDDTKDADSTQPRQEDSRASKSLSNVGASQVATSVPFSPPTEKQIKRMMAEFGEAGITDRDKRLAYVVNVIGRDIGTSTEMTKAEAVKVIDQLLADKEGN